MSRRCYVNIGIHAYDHRDPLPFVTDDRQIWDDVLLGDGYEKVLEIDPSMRANEIRTKLGQWSAQQSKAARRDEQADLLVLIWSGHAVETNEGLMLLTVEAPADDGSIAAWSAVPVVDLASMVMNASPTNAMVLLDTCFSGGGAAEAAKRAMSWMEREGTFTGFATIASCRDTELAADGRFADAMRDLLGGQSPEVCKAWSPGVERVTVAQFHSALRTVLATHGMHSTIHLSVTDFDILPNPFFDATRVAPASVRPVGSAFASNRASGLGELPQVLIVDDCEGEQLRALLDTSVHCLVVTTRVAALSVINDPECRLDAAFVDLYLDDQGPSGGREVLRSIADVRPELPRTIVSSAPYDDIMSDRRDYEFGAFTTIVKSQPATYGPIVRRCLDDMLNPSEDQLRNRVRAQIKRLADDEIARLKRVGNVLRHEAAREGVEPCRAARALEQRNAIAAAKKDALDGVAHSDAKGAWYWFHDLRQTIQDRRANEDLESGRRGAAP